MIPKQIFNFSLKERSKFNPMKYILGKFKYKYSFLSLLK